MCVSIFVGLELYALIYVADEFSDFSKGYL